MAWILPTIAIVAAVVAAAGAGYGAYTQHEAAQQAAKARKYAAQQQADAKKEAGEARARLVRYNADAAAKRNRAAEASTGALIGSGSLLEVEGRQAYNAELNAQYAKYPHTVAAQQADYEGDLFEF